MATPNFFIVGAPKSGTTAMNEYLDRHPDIFMAVKELHYFGSDLDLSRYRFRPKTLAEYLSHFKHAGDKARIGESSVWYLFSKLAAREIKEHFPSTSIIIMLRNPVEMIYSLHSQFLWDGNEDIDDFHEALSAMPDRLSGNRLPRTCYFPQGLQYLEVARYAEQVRRYIQTFGRENVHVIIYDDFRNNAAGEYRKTLQFLGMRDDFLPTLTPVNTNKRPRIYALRNFLVRPPDQVMWMPRKVVPRRVRWKIWSIMSRLNSIREERQPLDPEIRRKLQECFRPDIERLSELLERDLLYWVSHEAYGWTS